MTPAIISDSNFADIMGVSKHTLNGWEKSGKYPVHEDGQGKSFFFIKDLAHVPEIS